jgi:hypothetical protein
MEVFLEHLQEVAESRLLPTTAWTFSEMHGEESLQEHVERQLRQHGENACQGPMSEVCG